MDDTLTWDELPGAVRAAVERHTGPVRASAAGGQGYSSAVRLVLDTASGPVFIKGTGPGNGFFDVRHRARLALGAAVAPHVTALTPPLLFQAGACGWHVTGWPALPGRPSANLAPGTPDLPLVTGLLARLAGTTAPAVVTRTARDSWGHWAGSPDLLDGDMLTHADPKAGNFVIDGEHDRAWLVDWGWALRGPAWLTAALLVPALVESGWAPAAAEAALAGVPGWASAPGHALSAFADANAAMWDQAVKQADTPARAVKAGAARAWADHRAALTARRLATARLRVRETDRRSSAGCPEIAPQRDRSGRLR